MGLCSSEDHTIESGHLGKWASDCTGWPTIEFHDDNIATVTWPAKVSRDQYVLKGDKVELKGSMSSEGSFTRPGVLRLKHELGPEVAYRKILDSVPTPARTSPPHPPRVLGREDSPWGPGSLSRRNAAFEQAPEHLTSGKTSDRVAHVSYDD